MEGNKVKDTREYIICAYCTKGVYEQIANEYLLPSLLKLKLNHDVICVDNLGSWNSNTSFKPTFALAMLSKYPEYNIVLVDVDATIVKEPVLFSQIPEEYNIGAHYLDWGKHYGHSNGKEEFLSGTLFLRNNDKSQELVNYWAAECRYSSRWEQQILSDVLLSSNEKVYRLPKSYCNITTLPSGEKPGDFVEDSVINHFQASRKTRHNV